MAKIVVHHDYSNLVLNYRYNFSYVFSAMYIIIQLQQKLNINKFYKLFRTKNKI